MTFNLKYFLLSVLIFVIEVLIATVFKDIFFVRAFLGDVLVVMLIYTFVLSFFKVENRTNLIIGIFVFSVFIEILQYFKTADLIGLKPGSIPYIMLGNSFSWMDILCYAAGCGLVFLVEKYRNSIVNSNPAQSANLHSSTPEN